MTKLPLQCLDAGCWLTQRASGW